MSKQALQLITQPLLNAIPDDLTDRLDPVYVEYYNKYNAGRLHTHQIPIETFRANPLQYVIQWGRADGGEVFRISEQKCPVNGGEISIRIFEPGPADDATTPRRPLYINYHGGGFTFGDLEMDDPFCRRVCREVGCVAFDVEYRLSPDYRYPIPLEDCFAALKWVSLFPHHWRYRSRPETCLKSDSRLGSRKIDKRHVLDTKGKGGRVSSGHQPDCDRWRVCWGSPFRCTGSLGPR